MPLIRRLWRIRQDRYFIVRVIERIVERGGPEGTPFDVLGAIQRCRFTQCKNVLLFEFLSGKIEIRCFGEDS